jgi:hypothetical protein
VGFAVAVATFPASEVTEAYPLCALATALEIELLAEGSRSVGNAPTKLVTAAGPAVMADT